MSKHNYSQYSKKSNTAVNKNPDDIPVSVPESDLIVDDLVVVDPVAETAESSVKMEVETVTLPKTVKGTVTNCARLNVRAYPSLDAEVVCVLDVMSELIINTDKSTYDWLCVCTATGVDGYCMKKFVDADL